MQNKGSVSLSVAAEPPDDSLEVRFGRCPWRIAAGHSRRARLACQQAQGAGCQGAQPTWVPPPPSTPGLCFQVSLPACGASLDHCHLQHVLTVAYLTCLLKMPTAAAPAGPGSRRTHLYTSGLAVKLWVYQPGTRNAERSPCKYGRCTACTQVRVHV